MYLSISQISSVIKIFPLIYRVAPEKWYGKDRRIATTTRTVLHCSASC